jgi:hypothetical protein
MSRRQPVRSRSSTQVQDKNLLLHTARAPVFSDFDIINFQRAQALQQLHRLRMIELRIVRFNRQKESIARR